MWQHRQDLKPTLNMRNNEFVTYPVNANKFVLSRLDSIKSDIILSKAKLKAEEQRTASEENKQKVTASQVDKQKSTASEPGKREAAASKKEKQKVANLKIKEQEATSDLTNKDTIEVKSKSTKKKKKYIGTIGSTVN